MAIPWQSVVIYLICINTVTFCAFAWDKYRALNDGWRVRESTLLFYAFLGGSPAAKWAQYRIRHKTTKQPFGRRLNLVIVFQFFAFLLCAFRVAKTYLI